MNSKRMKESSSISFLSFVDLLLKMHKNQESYTIHVSNSRKEAGRVVIKNGEITFLSFNNKRGLDAIPLIKGQSKLTYRIARLLPMPKNKDLPETNEIISLLLASGSQQISGVRSKKIDTPHPSISLSSETINAFKNVLNDIIGPMADVFVSDYVVHASSVDEALKNLANELDDDDIKVIREELQKATNR